MPWGIFILALLITYLLQTTVLRLASVEPLDLLLTLALVCGLAAPVQEARLAGWFTGFAQDIGSAGPLGLHALLLGLAVLVLTRLRELVNQHLWWARWLIMFIVAFPAQVLLQLHLRFLQGAHLSWSRMGLDALTTAMLASLLAALLLGLPAVFRGRRHRRHPARW
ncbi:MAG: rod shape-determining protein MreD [Phycisphaerae bacterium]|nr:rod shape-determining protein MreD [Phycisphaerae bacterium]